MAKRKSPPNDADQTTENKYEVGAPYDMEKAISAAYLRSTGSNQIDTAESVGISERQLRNWEHSKWWADAMYEAHKRWLGGIFGLAKRGLLSALNDRDEYAATSRWIAERLVPELAPPRQRHAVGGDKDAPAVKVSQGLSEDTINDIRKKVLGVGDNDE